MRSMTDSPRSKLGVPAPRHPLTGELLREETSLLDFADRHGWKLTHQSTGGYYLEVRLKRDGNKADLSLTKSAYPQLRLATLNGIPVSQKWGFPMKQRVEAFLTGVECSCPSQPELYEYERVPAATCAIHGAPR